MLCRHSNFCPSDTGHRAVTTNACYSLCECENLRLLCVHLSQVEDGCAKKLLVNRTMTTSQLVMPGYKIIKSNKGY